MAFREPKKEKGARLKEPVAPPSPPDEEYLTVSLRHLRPSHCLTQCEQQEILAFADKVRILTQMSWKTINQAPRHGLGYEQISRKSLKVGVPDHVTAEVNIIAFRFSGKKPMVGYKDGVTFNVLWFDRAFDVYQH